MWSFQMSYADISTALREIEDAKIETLTDYQLQCLENSLAADPLVKALYLRYCPASNAIKKIINTSLERRAAQIEEERRRNGAGQGANPIGVHSPLLGDSRSKNKTWLHTHYPCSGNTAAYLEILHDVQQKIQSGKFDEILIADEQSRANERERVFNEPQTSASIEDIRKDFDAYFEHRKQQAQHGGTYGLQVLPSIHQWAMCLKQKARPKTMLGVPWFVP